MKKTAFYVITALAALSALAGCNKEVAKEPTFPQTQELSIAVGEKLDVSFTADAAWKLTIDANWLAFVDGEANVPQLSGAAGEQTVTITTTDVTDIFNEGTSVVEITMGNKTQTLCNITRTAEKRTVKMWIKDLLAAEGGIIPSLTLNYDSEWKGVKTFQLAFTANFDWAVQSYPKWMDATLVSGTASETPVFTTANYVSVKLDSLAKAHSGVIVIKDQNSDETISLNATYSGMGANDILYFTENNKEFWEINFSWDGYLMEKTFDGLTATDKTEFNVNVYSQDFCWAVYNYGDSGWEACYWLTPKMTEKGLKLTTDITPYDYGQTTRVILIPKAMLGENDYSTSSYSYGQINYSWISAHTELLFNASTGEYNETYSFGASVGDKPSTGGGGFLACLGDYMTHYTPVKFQEKYSYDPTTLMPSLPKDNTWCIEVPANIGTYPLQLAPLEFPADWYAITYDSATETANYLVEIVSQTGSWPEGQESKVFTHANIYAQGDWNNAHNGVAFSSEYFNEASGKCFVIFYKDAAEKENFKPSAAIEISKLQ